MRIENLLFLHPIHPATRPIPRPFLKEREAEAMEVDDGSLLFEGTPPSLLPPFQRTPSIEATLPPPASTTVRSPVSITAALESVPALTVLSDRDVDQAIVNAQLQIGEGHHFMKQLTVHGQPFTPAEQPCLRRQGLTQ